MNCPDCDVPMRQFTNEEVAGSLRDLPHAPADRSPEDMNLYLEDINWDNFQHFSDDSPSFQCEKCGKEWIVQAQTLKLVQLSS